MRATIVVVAVLLATPAAAQWKKVTPKLPSWRGTVSRVEDGDTLVVLQEKTSKQVRVRLYSADAPELDQPFGVEVRKAVIKLARGKPVTVSPQQAPDRRTRLVLASVQLGKTDLARQLLASGMAWHLRGPAPSRTLARLQREARAAKRGLWAGKDPVPPWKWRANRREGVDPGCYNKCLRTNAMRAVSWQAIQHQCRSRCPAPARPSTRQTGPREGHQVEVLRGGKIEQRKVR